MHLKKNVSLKEKNWFRTGGNASYFCQPTTESEFAQALTFAHHEKLPVLVFGEGANILMSDDGIDGLVIRPRLDHSIVDEVKQEITAGAGVSLPALIDYCLDHGLGGLEEFSGIPGTIGGSVYINVHYFEFLLSDFLVSARVIDKVTGQVSAVDKAWFAFGYNESTLQSGNYFLVEATFKLKALDVLQAAYAKGRRDEIIRHRSKRYPISNTCGSFFRNFHEHEIPFLINEKKVPYVAYYLDKIGVKGMLRVGDVFVSHQHANMLVTGARATSSDVINLARKMQEMVFENFGIVPQPECQFMGFKQYPLHQGL